MGIQITDTQNRKSSFQISKDYLSFWKPEYVANEWITTFLSYQNDLKKIALMPGLNTERVWHSETQCSKNGPSWR